MTLCSSVSPMPQAERCEPWERFLRRGGPKKKRDG